MTKYRHKAGVFGGNEGDTFPGCDLCKTQMLNIQDHIICCIVKYVQIQKCLGKSLTTNLWVALLLKLGCLGFVEARA